MPKSSRRTSEDDICIAFVQWFYLRYPKYKGLLFHIPNGGKRSWREGVLFRKLGVRAGVSDYCLIKPIGDYHGMYLEVKSLKGRLSDVQSSFLSDASEQEYHTAVAYGFDECIAAIDKYLSGAA